jgi:hypothetical protein
MIETYQDTQNCRPAPSAARCRRTALLVALAIAGETRRG